jgi:RHS repeat-associated protein
VIAQGETFYTRNHLAQGGIAGLISMEKPNGNTFYYHYDAQGNVTGLTNEKGKAVSQYGYEAFGKVTEKDGSFKGNPYRFSSKEHGAGNLYYYGARYYDPQAGRWLTPDPLGMVDGPNRYVFCANNPVNMADAWGLQRDSSL